MPKNNKDASQHGGRSGIGNMYVYIQTDRHTYAHVYPYLYTCIYIHTYIHVYPYTHIHTHLYTHIYERQKKEKNEETLSEQTILKIETPLDKLCLY